MTTKPLPDHGTYARANGSPGYRKPCKCEPCVLVRRARKKRESVGRQTGRPARVDAGPARRRLLQLNQTMGWNDISKATGISACHCRHIAKGRITEVNRGTQDKILAAQRGITGGIYIDATGSRRRVQALQAIGHSLRAIAEASDAVESRIQPVSAGQERVRRMHADKIANGYRKLAGTPGTSARSRTRAAAMGWPGPDYWDPDTIDNPEFQPAIKVTAKRSEIVAEDATWLLDNGLDLAQAAQRLGVSRFYVDRSLREARERIASDQLATAAA